MTWMIFGKQKGSVLLDIDEVKYNPGYYWCRGAVPFSGSKKWVIVRVYKPYWTKESGKSHCWWWYLDDSGGYEIIKGEWILIEPPGETVYAY